MRAVAILTVAAALAGCTMGGIGLTPAAIARGQAKSAVNSVVADRMPGVNVAPVTDCIIDNAALSEIYTLAHGAAVGVNAETVNTVMTIAKRPETLNCITRNGLSLL